jgi:hypothetical protein
MKGRELGMCKSNFPAEDKTNAKMGQNFENPDENKPLCSSFV